MNRSSLLALALLVAPVTLRAQTFVAPPNPDADKFGCTGFSYNVTLSHVTHTAETMTVSRVDSLSPAAIAGFQVGDSVTAINGIGIGDGPLGAHWRKPIGTRYV